MTTKAIITVIATITILALSFFLTTVINRRNKKKADATED